MRGEELGEAQRRHPAHVPVARDWYGQDGTQAEEQRALEALRDWTVRTLGERRAVEATAQRRQLETTADNFLFFVCNTTHPPPLPLRKTLIS